MTAAAAAAFTRSAISRRSACASRVLFGSGNSSSSSAVASCSYTTSTSQSRLRPTRPKHTASFHTTAFTKAKAEKGAAKGPAKSDDGAKNAAAGKKLVESSDPNVSVCPAGTVLSGLGIFKDRAEPIALPDDQYPTWLWSLIETSSTSSSGGLAIAGSANMSKGELRVAQKRAMKELRAKAEAAKRSAQRAAAGAVASGADKGGAERAAAAAASASMDEQIDIDRAPQTVDPAVAMAQAQRAAVQQESVQKAELRKANKAKIKAKNFLSAA
ncbi:hypothetical protein V8E36_008447 [Tilletia maclaganii]